ASGGCEPPEARRPDNPYRSMADGACNRKKPTGCNPWACGPRPYLSVEGFFLSTAGFLPEDPSTPRILRRLSFCSSVSTAYDAALSCCSSCLSCALRA